LSLDLPLDLLELAHTEGIIVDTWNFDPPIEAMYLSLGGKNFIALARSLLPNKRHLRCVFAEELGHHFMTAGDLRPKRFFRYSDRLGISREEYRARKWAAQYLMPINELEKAIRDGICEVWELADHFFVTEEMVHFRLHLSDITPLKYAFAK